eukprot:1563866-Amphidinium_carterae.1
MYAWLLVGESFTNKDDHWAKYNWPDHAARGAARAELAKIEGSEDLFQHERALRPGETDEPLDLA